MCARRSHWRSLTAVATVEAFLGAFGPPGCAPSQAQDTASISGLVYLDFNKDQIPDSGDFLIRNAQVNLLLSSDPSFHLIAFSNANGAYSFVDVPVSNVTGTFTLALNPYTATDGFDNLGQVFDASNTLTDPSFWGAAHNSPGDPQKDTFTDITLEPGFSGVGYDFSKLTFPLELFSKNIFINQGPPGPMGEPGEPTPEPATAALLALAVCSLVVRGRWRPLRTRR
jgi:hypothetical protein